MSQEIKEATQDETVLTAGPAAAGTADTKEETKGRSHAANEAAGNAEEEDFGSMLEDYMFIPKKGQTLTCPVTDVDEAGVYLNLSSKQTGLIPAHKISKSDDIRPGDKVPVIITRADSDEPYVYCDLIRDKAWSELDQARVERTTVDCYVENVNKGGIDAEYKGIHVFIPGSKSGMGRDEDKGVLVGKTVHVRILETDRKTRRIIGAIRSERSEQMMENARKLWEVLDVGQRYEGTVKNLTDFAAFVDIGGIDGLCHVSQISYEHVGKPSDVLKPGDKVTVWVSRLDKSKKRVSLTMKDPSKDCWAQFAEKHSPGETISGTVRNLTEFGAFVNVAPGVEGLVRVSQISYQHVDVPSDVLNEGDAVNVKILEIDPKGHRVALTMKGIDQPD